MTQFPMDRNVTGEGPPSGGSPRPEKPPQDVAPELSYSDSKHLALEVVPKVSAVYSMLGSAYIVFNILSSKKALKKTNNRILLAMSILDFLSSLFIFLGNWMVPSYLAGGPEPHANGTIKTCSAQGFFLQLGLAVPLYNASLAVYFFLVINLSWPDTRIRKVAPFLLVIPAIWGLGTSVTGLALELYNYNPHLRLCWIAGSPVRRCDTAFTENEDKIPCLRGENASAFRIAFGYVPLFFCVLVMGVSFFLIYHAVRHRERAAVSWQQSWIIRKGSTDQITDSSARVMRAGISLKNLESSVNPSSKPKIKRSQQIASQSISFVLAFFITWTFPLINMVLVSTNAMKLFPLDLLVSIFLPLQGFLNLLVYMRPGYLRYRKENPDVWSVSKVANKVMWNYVFSCWQQPIDSDDANDDPSRLAQGSVGGNKPVVTLPSNNEVLHGNAVTPEEEKTEDTGIDDVAHVQPYASRSMGRPAKKVPIIATRINEIGQLKPIAI